MKELNLQNADIQEIADVIQNGGIVILPFDTVYGFVCDSKNEAALEKIYELKNVPYKKQLDWPFPILRH